MDGQNERISSRAVSRSYDRLLDKMYISNVGKRLRDLRNPSDIDCRRWVWELLQNAKDSISADKERSSVKAEIIVDDANVRFIHDGSPFNSDAFLALLYKYSDGKETQESTGRFGTGFLTTHCLSKVVDISGDMYEEDGSVQGFSVTMYRDGLLDSELLEGVERMRQSMSFGEERKGRTTFSYRLSGTDSVRRAVALGLKEFRTNICKVMLFCPELKSVSLDDHGRHFVVTRYEESDVGDGVRQVSILEEDGGSKTMRRFVVSSVIEHSDELTALYKRDRDLRVDAALAVSSDFEVLDHHDDASVYCVFPLVGVEAQLNEPVLLNSPDFEPDPEREHLLFEGAEVIAEKGVPSENGINRKIYGFVPALYEKLVRYLETINGHSMYRLAIGLDGVVKGAKKIDDVWYKENVTDRYRRVLLGHNVATVCGCKRKLQDVTIVKESSGKRSELLRSIVSELAEVNPPPEDNDAWAKLVWKDEALTVWNAESLCQYVGAKADWNEVVLKDGVGRADWFNRACLFAWDTDQKLLSDYKMLPDMSGGLHSYAEEDFLRVDGVDTSIISMLTDLGSDITGKLLSADITEPKVLRTFDHEKCASYIIDLTKQIVGGEDSHAEKFKLLAPVLRSVSVKDDDGDARKKLESQRELLWKTLDKLYGPASESKAVVSPLLPQAWSVVDKWSMDAVACRIAELQRLENMMTASVAQTEEDAVTLLNHIYSLFKGFESFSTQPVFLCQDGVFRPLMGLSKDREIPEAFKDAYQECCGENLRAKLLDARVRGIATEGEYTIGDLSSELNEFLSKANISQKLKVAINILGILPRGNEGYRRLNRCIGGVYGGQITECREVPPCQFDWHPAIDVVVRDVLTKVTQCRNLDGIRNCESFSFLKESSDTEIIKWVDGFIRLVNGLDNGCCMTALQDPQYRYFTNQHGEFCAQRDISRDVDLVNYPELKTLAALPPVNIDVCSLLLHPDSSLSDLVGEGQWRFESLTAKIDGLFNDYKKQNLDPEEEDFKRLIFKLGEMCVEDRVLRKAMPHYDRTKDFLRSRSMGEEKMGQYYRLDQKLPDGLLEKLLSDEVDLAAVQKALAQGLQAPEAAGKDTFPQTAGAEVAKVSLTDGQYAGITAVQRKELSLLAKKLVREQLSSQGYSFTQGICEDEFSLINGVLKDGVEYPLVVHSYLDRSRPFQLNASDWIQLMKPKSMLLVRMRNESSDMICSVPFRELVSNREKIELSFSTANLDIRDRLGALASVMRYFKGLHFDFGSLLPTKAGTAQLFDFPENELTDAERKVQMTKDNVEDVLG